MLVLLVESAESFGVPFNLLAQPNLELHKRSTDFHEKRLHFFPLLHEIGVFLGYFLLNHSSHLQSLIGFFVLRVLDIVHQLFQILILLSHSAAKLVPAAFLAYELGLELVDSILQVVNLEGRLARNYATYICTDWAQTDIALKLGQRLLSAPQLLEQLAFQRLNLFIELASIRRNIRFLLRRQPARFRGDLGDFGLLRSAKILREPLFPRDGVDCLSPSLSFSHSHT